jgi:hypothetical protein
VCPICGRYAPICLPNIDDLPYYLDYLGNRLLGTGSFLAGQAGKWVDQMAAFISDLGELLHHPYIACIVFVALVFDFLNGFHDAANSIATIVGTRVLRPFHAVLWAAWWNFVAAWVFGIHVANTVAT